ncbi:hypothetical protein [Rubrivirga sp.]|uniref:hypothetical protein n=1 Tax=Rubrivirga sp. TaxID=1885344 RepID=UPI003C737F14
MRTLALAALLLVALPAQAQLTSDVPDRRATVALSETPGTLGLGTLFNAETLDFSQSVEVSYGGGVGGTLGMGLYTASLRWQPSSKLAGRVDIGVAQSLGGSAAPSLGLNQQDPQLFLRNAEIAYRPIGNATIHLRVSQSPYGTYASPYGYGRYGRGSALGLGSSVDSSGDLFFRDTQ